MTTTQEAHDREQLLDQQAQQSQLVVPGSCPFYRHKYAEGKVTSCEGDVVFAAGEDYGVCQSCGRHVSIIMEM